jgi:hypothetical protein
MFQALMSDIKRKHFLIDINDAERIINEFNTQLKVFDNFKPGDKLIVETIDNIQVARIETNNYYLAPLTRWVYSQGRQATLEYMKMMKGNIEGFDRMLSLSNNYKHTLAQFHEKMWLIKDKFNQGIRMLRETYKNDATLQRELFTLHLMI